MWHPEAEHCIEELLDPQLNFLENTDG